MNYRPIPGLSIEPSRLPAASCSRHLRIRSREGDHADDELFETALNEKSEEDLTDQLLQELHSNIDAIFAGSETGLNVYQQIFALGCRLLKSSTPSVDLFIASALRTPGASLAEANNAAKKARDTVSALVRRIGDETAHSTAAVGLIGAYITVQQLAAFTEDP